MSLRVLVVDGDAERAAGVVYALTAAGYLVASVLETGTDLYAKVRELQPDVIIIDMESPDRDMLEHLHVINRDDPRAIVMFCQDDANETISAALKAGVSAYVVDGLQPHRIKPILQTAVARFQDYQDLRRELEETKSTLAERKTLERAKGILMKQRGMSEEDAYQALRKSAMNRNKRIIEVAENLIAAYELLG
jgi:two-component system, response regulator / RNA-binding antiterminator